MRNDSALITGMNSAAARKQEAARQEQLIARKQAKAAMKPTEQFITDEVAKQEKKIMDELASLPINYETVEENIKLHLLVLQRNLLFIRDFKLSLMNRVRIPGETNE